MSRVSNIMYLKYQPNFQKFYSRKCSFVFHPQLLSKYMEFPGEEEALDTRWHFLADFHLIMAFMFVLCINLSLASVHSFILHMGIFLLEVEGKS